VVISLGQQLPAGSSGLPEA